MITKRLMMVLTAGFFVAGVLIMELQAGDKDTPPLGWWKMDEASSGSAKGAMITDSSGNGYNGLGSAGGKEGTGLDWIPGKIGRGALTFDGIDDYIDLATYFPALTGTFTIECWVKPGTPQVQYADIFGNHGLPPSGMVMQQNSTDVNKFYFAWGNGASWVQTQPNVEFKAEVWQHLAVVKTSTHCYVYVNGIEKSRVENDTEVTPNASLKFMIGRGHEMPRYFKGAIDDFRIYDYARTPTQIAGDSRQESY